MATAATRFTIAQFDEMIEKGVFGFSNKRRFELIHGELRKMSPIGEEHEEIVDYLNQWSVTANDLSKVRVRIQHSVGIPELESVPYPDVSWVRQQSYRKRRPTPKHVLLIIEVAKSSLRYDRGIKADLYAQVGIKDYWIVDIRQRCLHVLRKPAASGYREITTYLPGEQIRPLALPKASLAVKMLFADA